MRVYRLTQRRPRLLLILLISTLALLVDGKAIAASSKPVQVEFGNLVPSPTPVYAVTKQQIFVHSPDSPWSLYVQAGSGLVGHDDNKNFMPIRRLEWSIDGNYWHAFEGIRQGVLLDQPPTDDSGVIVGIDYRLYVTWDDVPDLYTADILYSLTGGGMLATSYITPDPFNPREHESLELTYYLRTASTVHVQIYDESGALVFEEVVSGDAGWNRFTWDGATMNGKYPLPGLYRYRINTPNELVVAAGTINIESSRNKENTIAATTSQGHSPDYGQAFQLSISPSASTASVGDVVVVLVEVMTDDDLVGGVLEVELPNALIPVHAEPAPELQSRQRVKWSLPPMSSRSVFRVELGMAVVPGVSGGVYEIKARADGHFPTNQSSTAVQRAAIDIKDEPLFSYGRVIGRVVDESGLVNKLDGLLVFIEGLGIIKTGAYGFFECNLPPGRYLVRLDKSSLPTGIWAAPPVASVQISSGSSTRVVFRLVRQMNDEMPERWGYLRANFDGDWLPSLTGGIMINSELGGWLVRGDWWWQQSTQELKSFRPEPYAWTSSANQLRLSNDNVDIRVGEGVLTWQHIFGAAESIAVQGVNASWDGGSVSVGRELSSGAPYFSALYYPSVQRLSRLTFGVRAGEEIGLGAGTTKLVNLGKIHLDGAVTRSSSKTWGGALALELERRLSEGSISGVLRLRLGGRPEVGFGLGWNRSEGSFGFKLGSNKTFYATGRTERGDWRLDFNDSSPWGLSWQAANREFSVGVGGRSIDFSGRHAWGKEGALLWSIQPGRGPLLTAYDDTTNTSWELRLGEHVWGEISLRLGPWAAAGGWGQGAWGLISRNLGDLRLALSLGASDNKTDIGLAAAYLPESRPLWVQGERHWSASGAAGSTASIHIGWDGRPGIWGSLFAKEETAGGTRVLTHQAAMGISLTLGSSTELFGQGLRLWQSPSGERVDAWALGLQRALWEDIKIRVGWQYTPAGKTVSIHHQGTGPFLEIGWW